jgi:SAM-dependent methyltransferase
MKMQIEKSDSAADGLDLGQLMDQIRLDAEKRKRDALRNGASVVYRQLITQAFDVLLPSSAPENLAVPELRIQPELEKRDRYHINDLLGFHDEQFIRNAYHVILKRDPDDFGFAQYLQSLRSGNYSKIDILRSLRFSPEGQIANVEIEGLGKLSAFRSLYRVPVVGYLLRLAVAIVRLPVLINHHRQLEAYTVAQLERLASHGNEAVAHFSDFEQRHSETSRRQFQIMQEQIDELTNTARAQIDSLLREQRALRDELSSAATRGFGDDEAEAHLLDSLYTSLEDGLRGTPGEIKEEAKVYLPILKDAGITSGILDVGCGRGEWLEVLKEAGFQARGIDNNHIQIQRCKSLSLDVVESEILKYLRTQEDASLNAVTAFHFAEHLPLDTLVRFFDEVRRTLRPGGLMILETPNPENLLVGSCNFYLDPSHNKPIPIPTMKLLVEARGFECQEVRKLRPVPGMKVEVKDQLTSHVNHFLYGPMNYAVIARKPAVRTQ